MISSSADVLPRSAGAMKEQNPWKWFPRWRLSLGFTQSALTPTENLAPGLGDPPQPEVFSWRSDYCIHLFASLPLCCSALPCTFSLWFSFIHIHLPLAHLQDFSSVSTTFIREQTYNPSSGCQSIWILVIFSAMNCITALSLVLEERWVNIIYLRRRLGLNHLIVLLICEIIPNCKALCII